MRAKTKSRHRKLPISICKPIRSIPGAHILVFASSCASKWISLICIYARKENIDINIRIRLRATLTFPAARASWNNFKALYLLLWLCEYSVPVEPNHLTIQLKVFELFRRTLLLRGRRTRWFWRFRVRKTAAAVPLSLARIYPKWGAACAGSVLQIN